MLPISSSCLQCKPPCMCTDNNTDQSDWSIYIVQEFVAYNNHCRPPAWSLVVTDHKSQATLNSALPIMHDTACTNITVLRTLTYCLDIEVGSCTLDFGGVTFNLPTSNS